ncbi:hypothetical protein [Tropicimonas sp. IMCC34043]|uniref:hypothetical protein n=1 Tax=Tropicimonas sp. IMCC34043 TaxID=2248760 RepID=UPI000E2278BF|nr:hypothetical protein [Tropicimonas sp. IMCC34043]
MMIADKSWLCLSLVLGAGAASAEPVDTPRKQLLIVLTGESAGLVQTVAADAALPGLVPVEPRPIVAEWMKGSHATIVPVRGAIDPSQEERS